MVKRSNPDQFQLRLPPGLRERIKAYAEQHGRSMNTEIVRILEREFPPTAPVGHHIDELLDMLTVLRGAADERRIHQLVDEIQETVIGLYSGRIYGLDDTTRAEFKRAYQEWKEREYRSLQDMGEANPEDLDLEELDMRDLTGRTEKLVFPPERDD